MLENFLAKLQTSFFLNCWCSLVLQWPIYVHGGVLFQFFLVGTFVSSQITFLQLTLSLTLQKMKDQRTLFSRNENLYSSNGIINNV